MSKDNFGYQSRLECSVCGSDKNNQMEPRFGYTVCEDHQHIPPVEVSNLKWEREEKIKRN